MRDLNSANQAIKSTGHFFRVSLLIPIIMGLGAWALATGASPKIPLKSNPLAILGLAISLVAIALTPIPSIFKWDWQTKYFGATMFPIASGSVIGLYPILCMVQYSSLPISARLLILFSQILLISHWCQRFSRIYKKIYTDKKSYNYIYREDLHGVYYFQDANRKLLEKSLKFESCPPSKYFIFFGLAGFSALPFASDLSRIVGLPFIHIFLSIFATPLNLLFLGLSTKAWLVFYYYPRKIEKQTRKLVYVDISSRAGNMTGTD